MRSVLKFSSAPVRLLDYFEATADEMLQAARDQGLEGVIAKRKDSRYEGGKRSGSWVKHRLNAGQELVIGGYVPGTHGLGDWEFDIQNLENPNRFRNSDSSAPDGMMGFCDEKHQAIYIHSGLPDRHFRQTVLHEIAHALTPNDKGHGEEWINKAGQIRLTNCR